jgi:hypothetical protein
MLTKEKVAEVFKGVARIFPGIPSYQERAGLRAQDKVIREQLAARITEQVGNLHQIMAELSNRAALKPLANLDELSRKLMRLSDTIRFASYGYAGLFSGTAVEIAPITHVLDDSDSDESPKEYTIGSGVAGELTSTLSNAYKKIVTGEDKRYLEWLTNVK